MARSTFSGPVRSLNGFEGPSLKLAAVALSDLPAASADNEGTIYIVTGTSSGTTIVYSDGTDNIDVLTGTAVA